jgi:hypothetical protein
VCFLLPPLVSLIYFFFFRGLLRGTKS